MAKTLKDSWAELAAFIIHKNSLDIGGIPPLTQPSTASSSKPANPTKTNPLSPTKYKPSLRPSPHRPN